MSKFKVTYRIMCAVIGKPYKVPALDGGFYAEGTLEEVKARIPQVDGVHNTVRDLRIQEWTDEQWQKELAVTGRGWINELSRIANGLALRGKI